MRCSDTAGPRTRLNWKPSEHGRHSRMVGRADGPAKIHGSEALFIADSGAFYSMITPAAAAQFKLTLPWRGRNTRVISIGAVA
jgi:hypothetical protein